MYINAPTAINRNNTKNTNPITIHMIANTFVIIVGSGIAKSAIANTVHATIIGVNMINKPLSNKEKKKLYDKIDLYSLGMTFIYIFYQVTYKILLLLVQKLKRQRLLAMTKLNLLWMLNVILE